MHDISDSQQLLLSFQLQTADLWSVLYELAEKQETELRRILRPHADLEFGRDDESHQEMELRRRLDAALGVLTQLEVGYQTGVFSANDLPTTTIPGIESLNKLVKSEAFLRYVNAYLYFGIRFLAGRSTPMRSSSVGQASTLLARDSNQQPFPLQTPPSLGATLCGGFSDSGPISEE